MSVRLYHSQGFQPFDRRRSSGKEAGGFQFVRVWIFGKAAAVAPGSPFGGSQLGRHSTGSPGCFPPRSIPGRCQRPRFSTPPRKKSGRPSPRSLPHKTNILSEGMVYVPPLQRGRLTSVYRKTFRRTYEGLRLSPSQALQIRACCRLARSPPLFIAGKSTGSQTRPQGLHGEARSVGKIPTGKEARLSPRSMPVMPALGVRFGFVSPVGGSLK